MSGEVQATPQRIARIRWRPRSLHIGLVATLAAAVLAILGRGSAGAFFGAGALLLMGGVAFAAWFLRTRELTQSLRSAGDLARRNTSRRLGRSLATITIFASGVFIVVAVDSFRKRPEAEASARRDSGTGGFALVAESALPIYEDLNSAKGREAYALDETALGGARIVPMRVRDGDDASCLNLNRALQPRLLAVKPSELADRHAFQFSERAGSWDLLNATDPSAVVPGIVDANTLQYALQKKLGDTIEYRDERGQPFAVRLVATVEGTLLQGNVLIAEQAFIDHFPGAGGYRYFLIDAPGDHVRAAAEELARGLQDRGLEVIPAARRLAEFDAVENTYLSIFQALGGLGLLLGTAGLAIVVARNVLERHREFGLLEAVGFRHRAVRALVFAEHRWLIALGLLIGIASAALAVLPQLIGKAGGFPVREFALLAAALGVGGISWTWLATRLALRGSLLPALRNE
jgi:hypothetical protein